MIPVDLLICIVVGGFAGYFLKFWLQVVVIIVALAYYKYASRDDDGNAAHLAWLYWIGACVVGMIVGNIIYCLPFLFNKLSSFSFGPPPNIKNWFIR